MQHVQKQKMKLSTSQWVGLSFSILICMFGGLTIFFNIGQQDESFAAPPGSSSIGNYVWFDDNENGQQDATENGMANIGVNLYSNSGNLLDSTQSDNSGFYQFSNLNPGAYYLVFSLPANKRATLQENGNSASDSNIDTSGRTKMILLGVSQSRDDIDAGIINQANSGGNTVINKCRLGNLVFEDVNQNGMQDASDHALANVTIKLYDSLLNLIAITQSDNSGMYLFDSLDAGFYCIKVHPVNNYVPTLQHIGTPNIDNDINSSWQSELFELTEGLENMDLDIGLKSSLTFLPVEISEYSAVLNQQKVFLNWTTQSETNNNYFEIQRTIDPNNENNFEILGKQKGAGNSKESINYEFIDENPLTETSFYRLVQFDFDGSYTETEWLKIQNFASAKKLELNIYPNPAVDNLNLDLIAQNGLTNITIYNTEGKVIFASQEEIQNEKLSKQINVSNLNAGTYTVKLIQGENVVFQKFIKL